MGEINGPKVSFSLTPPPHLLFCPLQTIKRERWKRLLHFGRFFHARTPLRRWEGKDNPQLQR